MVVGPLSFARGVTGGGCGSGGGSGAGGGGGGKGSDSGGGQNISIVETSKKARLCHALGVAASRLHKEYPPPADKKGDSVDTRRLLKRI